MVFYGQLQQMDVKWSDKWMIIRRRWMEYMSISDENRDKSMTQHLSQNELVACPQATQYLFSIQTRNSHAIVVSMLPCIVTKTTTLPLMTLMEYDSSFQLILETSSNSGCCIFPSKVALKWLPTILVEFQQLAKYLAKTLAEKFGRDTSI